MKKHTLLFRITAPLTMVLLFSLTVQLSFAQVIVLKETVPEDFEELDDDFGPNRKRFSHPYASYGSFANVYDHTGNNQDKIYFLKSLDLGSGTRSYLNIGRVYSITFDTHLSMRMFGLRVENDTPLPLSKENLNKAKYWLGSFGFSIGNHFNFKPNRGNQLGTYLHIGGYGNLNFLRRFTGYYNESTLIPFDYKINLKNFKEIELLDYGLAVRYGKSNFTFFAKYRISDFFKNKIYSLNELPRVTFGIELFAGHI
jgi:hypothetical protein